MGKDYFVGVGYRFVAYWLWACDEGGWKVVESLETMMTMMMDKISDISSLSCCIIPCNHFPVVVNCELCVLGLCAVG